MDFGHFAMCLLFAATFGMLFLVLLWKWNEAINPLKSSYDPEHSWVWFVLAFPCILFTLALLLAAWNDILTGWQHFTQLL